MVRHESNMNEEKVKQCVHVAGSRGVCVTVNLGSDIFNNMSS